MTRSLAFYSKPKRANPEAQLQSAVVQHLKLCAGPNVLFFHVPNGMKSDGRHVHRMKSMGLTPGVADLVICVNGQAKFLELKSENGRARESQLAFSAKALEAGCDYASARNINEALTILHNWGAIRRARAA